MKLFSELDNDNFELYAAKHYNNFSCISTEEFYEDVARFKYVLRLLRRYRQSGIIQERLILNHIIVIYNVFEILAANKMMFFKIDEDLWPSLKSFLIYLNYLPENNKYRDVTVDLNIAKKLQTL
tara:strand:- start:714 stop:1085 length:372 start_codon:yes stop_codon:yes gene_type:complete